MITSAQGAEMLQNLNLPVTSGQSTEDGYQVQLADSNMFGLCQALLDKNSALDYLDDDSYATVEEVVLSYSYNQFRIQLVGDLNQDQYTLIITEED